MPCIMPEMPYCPACQFGHIVPLEDGEACTDMLGGNCHWTCLCTEGDYEKWAQSQKMIMEDGERHGE